MKPVRDEAGYRRLIAYLGEVGLEPDVRGICLRHAVTLRDVYLDSSAAEVHAARTEIWWWLESKHRKSRAQIGRLFDRDATTVTAALNKLEKIAAEMGKELDEESVVHEVAVSIVKKALETRERVAREQADRMAARAKKLSSGGGL